MIENNYIELGKRAVACRGWRWMPGMQVEWVGMGTGWRMLSKTQSWYERKECEDGEPGGPNTIPDLTDPATLGCLLALVREARGEPTYLPTCLDVHDEAWVVNPPIPWRQTRYESYASVLVAALEAAS